MLPSPGFGRCSQPLSALLLSTVATSKCLPDSAWLHGLVLPISDKLYGDLVAFPLICLSLSLTAASSLYLPLCVLRRLAVVLRLGLVSISICCYNTTTAWCSPVPSYLEQCMHASIVYVCLLSVCPTSSLCICVDSRHSSNRLS